MQYQQNKHLPDRPPKCKGTYLAYNVKQSTQFKLSQGKAPSQGIK